MTHQTNDSETMTASEKVNEIKGLLASLLDTTKIIKTAVDEEDMEVLISKLNERQILLDRMGSLYETPDPEGVKAIKAETREALKGIVEEIGRLDAASIRSARDKRDIFMEQIRALNQQKVGMDKYGKKSKKTPAVYIDKKK